MTDVSGASGEVELIQLLTPEGERLEHPDYAFDGDDEQIKRLYRDMVLSRRVDAEATALQRQGELGIWASSLGQEAAQVGSGRAMLPQDYVFPTYREHGVAWCCGVDPLRLLAMFRGVDHGAWDSQATHFALYTIVIGAQALHATGYAMGVERDGLVGTGDRDRDVAVIAYFGDGATSQGDVNESFIFASSYNAPVVFFCQNNQWAISEPIERQSRIPLYRRASGFGFPGVRVDGNDVLAVHAVTAAALDRARSGNGPTFIEAYTYRMGAHTTSDDPTKYRLADELEHWRLKDPIARVRAYLTRKGSADDDFFAGIEAEATSMATDLRAACLAMPDPSMVEAFDWVYAEQTPLLVEQQAAVRGVPRHVRGGGAMTKLTLSKAINAGLRRALEADPKVILAGEDIGKLGGVFRVTEGLQKDFGEHRVIDSPLAESGIIGTAVGMAMRGYRPVCEIQFDGFVYPAFDQIVSQVAKMHFRSHGQLKMPMVIRIPFGGGIGAVEHHSESPEAYFAHTAGLKVVACSNPVDAYWMIQQAVASDDPVVFFEPKRRYHEKAEVDESATPPPLHAAQVVRPGRDVTLIAYGPMVKTCLDAAAAAAEEGRDLEVIDLRSLSPLDMATVARRSPRPAGRSRCTRRRSTSASARSSRPGSPSSASTPSRLRCSGSAGSTCPTRPAGSRTSIFLTLTGCSMRSTVHWPTERTDDGAPGVPATRPR